MYLKLQQAGMVLHFTELLIPGNMQKEKQHDGNFLVLYAE